jgi:multidrug resistance efflux pump
MISSANIKLQARLRKMRLLILASALLVLPLMAAMVLLLPVDEKVNAGGVVRAREDIHVFAPQEGVIKSVRCSEGAQVHAGDLLFELDDTPSRQHLSTAEASLSEALATLKLKQAQLEKTNELPLPKEFWHVPEELVQAKEKLALAERESNRYESLSKSGGGSRQEYDRALAEREVARVEVEKIGEKIEVLRHGFRDRVLAEAGAEVAAAKSVVDRWSVERDNASALLARCRVLAPQDGIITLVEKRRAGMAVSGGEKLAHLSRGPADRVKLSMGEEKIKRVAPGQVVIMRPLSIPWFKYGYARGVVLEVSPEPSGPEEEATAPSQQRSYKALVEVTETPTELALGSTVNADVILRHRPLWCVFLPAAWDR